ncbi:MAG: hypothetical protein ACRCZR_07890 [Cetobacterium sp.]
MELKISLFITSFLPLWISIIFVNSWNVLSYALPKVNGNFNLKLLTFGKFSKLYFENWLEISFSMILLILFLVPAIFIYLFLKDKEKSYNNPIGIIKKATRAHNLGSDFLLAYILPMIAFDFGNLKDVILFSIIFITLGFLCIRNENIYTNIFLEFLGYQMFYVDFNKDILEDKKTLKKEILFLSKNDLRMEIGSGISYYEITNFIYINLVEGDSKNE